MSRKPCAHCQRLWSAQTLVTVGTADKDIINPKTAKQKAVAAQQKAYREANKDRVAAQQKCIALVRKAQGMTQSELAAIAGVTRVTVSLWETGAVKANWDKLCAVLPELEAYRP